LIAKSTYGIAVGPASTPPSPTVPDVVPTFPVVPLLAPPELVLAPVPPLALVALLPFGGRFVEPVPDGPTPPESVPQPQTMAPRPTPIPSKRE
jgi:hypothetical protein